MRCIALLFALYLSVLACLPCTDWQAPAEQRQTAELAAASPVDQHSDSDSDWCTPLCQCQCCAGITLPATAIKVQSPVVPVVQYDDLLPVAIIDRVITDVWQPPQA